MDKLLIDDENQIVVLPSLAVEIGVDCAIVLQHLHILQQEQEEHGNGGWVTRSLDEWEKYSFPFWSIYEIGCVFRKLVALPFFIETVQFNIANSRDYTVSYKIDRDIFAKWKGTKELK